MPNFLDVLKTDAADLAESELPTIGEVRGVVAALVKRLGKTLPELIEDAAKPIVAELDKPLPPAVPGTPVVVPQTTILETAATAASPIVTDAPAAVDASQAGQTKTLAELKVEFDQLQAQMAAAIANEQAPQVTAG